MDKDYLVKKWLNNSLSDAETQAFKALEDADIYEEIINEAQRFNGKTNARVHSFEALDNKLNANSKNAVPWIKIVSGIAAVLIISLALFKFLKPDAINTFSTKIAQQQIINLPDHSIVNLNQSSTLAYNTTDWDNNRLIDLKGEAYFDVKKGKHFEVITNQGSVRVLGTEFNVLSRDSLFKVSCYEGLVEIAYKGKTLKLPAGNEFILKAGKKETMSSIVLAEPYWLKNMSVFDNAPFKAVIKELESHYSITIKFPEHMTMNFTGAFEHDHLDNALKSITKPLNLTYTKQGSNEVIIKQQ